jgi:hypothetical protein
LGDPSGRKQPIAIAIADGVIDLVRTSGLDLRLANGNLYVCEGNIWHEASAADIQWLRCLIQRGAEQLGDDARLGLVNAAWKRLNEHPDLFVRDVVWKDEPREPEVNLQVVDWVRKSLVQADSYKVANDDLLHSFSGWQRLEIGDEVRPLDIRAFIPRLHATCPQITRVTVMGNRYAGGVKLNAEGLKYWEHHRGCGSRGIAFSSDYVNTIWKGRSNLRAFKSTIPPHEVSSL